MLPSINNSVIMLLYCKNFTNAVVLKVGVQRIHLSVKCITGIIVGQGADNHCLYVYKVATVINPCRTITKLYLNNLSAKMINF